MKKYQRNKRPEPSGMELATRQQRNWWAEVGIRYEYSEQKWFDKTTGAELSRKEARER